MRIGCREACACLSSCLDHASQAFTATVLACSKIAKDPEALQKSCILAHSILLGSNLYFHTTRFLKLIEVLDVAQSFDFYGFCKLPRYISHTYQAERIDGTALLNTLETVLCDKWDIGQPGNDGDLQDPNVRQFAKDQLDAFLTLMMEDGIDYRTEDEFRTALKNWLSLALRKNKEGFDPDIIDLSSLSIPLKKSSWLEVLADFSFIFADIFCVPDFLQQWNIIDLSSISNRLGSFQAFSWLTKWSLDEYVRGAMCFGFAMQFFEALHCLVQPDLKPEHAKSAKWLLVVSTTEFLYNSAILQKKDIRLITFFAFIAKFTGVASFLMQPEHSFFSDS